MHTVQCTSKAKYARTLRPDDQCPHPSLYLRLELPPLPTGITLTASALVKFTPEYSGQG